MNKTYKYTLTAHEKKEISFDTGVARLAIANGDGVDGSTTVIMSEITKQHSGDIVSFLDGADAPFADFTVNIAAVQSGSGDPSPDNVRPISGFDSVVVTRTGKNLVDIADRTITSQFQSEYFTLKKGTYTLSLFVKNNTTIVGTCYLRKRDNVTNVAVIGISESMSSRVSTSFTLTDDTNLRFIVSGSSPGYNYDISHVQIEIGTTATAYEPYNGNTYNIDWQSTAGTVYGGYINPLTGVLTVTHANIPSYNGETINEPWISSMDVYSAGITPTTGAQVVYPLSTPVTYQLTPTEIRSLLGVNNVWANCGPVDVRYFVQSTQPMIDYVDDKTPVFFDAVEDLSTYDVSLVGATSTDIKNYLLANKNANIVIRVKRYSTILLYYLREYSPNYFAEFATHAVIFDAEGTKSMRIDYLRLDLTQETSDFTDDYIILPTS